ncbi:hypothetical protein KR200_006152 [Drosophila serrata]|nr:hypothetical protein KR200_006152 [Drosophila serrata]
MPRTEILKQTQSQDLDPKKKIKTNTPEVEINKLNTRYQKELSHQIKSIRNNTNKQVLQMKCAVPEPPVSKSKQVGLELSFLRWPRAGEEVFSTAGSPLAVLRQPEHCVNVHIPTRKGIIKVKPHKMKQVDGDTLMTMDQNTFSQVKVLNTNLEMIIDKVTKMGKL